MPPKVVTFLLGLKTTNKQMRKIEMAAKKDLISIINPLR